MRKLEWVLGVALIASTAAAFVLKQQLDEERALTARLRAQGTASVTVPEQAPPAATATMVETPSPAPAMSVDTTPPASGTRNVAGRKEDWDNYQRQLLKDPRYVEAMREQRRLTYRLRRDNAIRLFGFTPETADAIIDLDVDREIQMMKLSPTAAGVDLRSQYEELQHDHDAKLLALLGQDRFDRWQNYMETRGTRMQVDRFRTQLNGADTLRDDQVEPLITALAAEQKQMQADLQEYRDTLSWDGDTTESARKFRARQLEITQAANKRMVANAAAILSSSQVQRLSDMLNNDMEQRATQERIEALQQKIKTAPDSGTAN